uniref:Dynein heavy chain 12, axonemal-like isoform X3 n=1 Tax=Petromyzon marinus TaxID=7757 RepID=A0AAJ7T450_PETMA|nr:dynein heavy chain 12, axonemal-like isoform X3 [Petromyzon marinus]
MRVRLFAFPPAPPIDNGWLRTGAISYMDEMSEEEMTELALQMSLQEMFASYERKSSDAGESTCTNSDLFVKLTEAITKGELDGVKGLLRHSRAPCEWDEDGWSVLHRAAAQGDAEILRAVVDAVKRGSLPAAELLLRYGANVNHGHHNRWTALHEAARLGRRDFAALLLRNRAYVDQKTAFGFTALAIAAQHGHADVLRLLLDRGANVLAQAEDAATVLYEASSHGHIDCITLLLQHGANPNIPNATGHLPIHRAAFKGHVRAVKQLLLETRERAVERSGVSPLHSAVAGGRVDCLKVLLESGYDPDFLLADHVAVNYTDNRRSALFFAVCNGDMEATKLLLNAGAKVNQDPMNALLVAMHRGDRETVALLLRHGANVDCQMVVNTTRFPAALQYAFKDESLLRALLDAGCDARLCFECSHDAEGRRPSGPRDLPGWSSSIIQDTEMCEMLTLSWVEHLAGRVVRVLLDYVDFVPICVKLKAVLRKHPEWEQISHILENARPLKHLCRLVIRERMGTLRLRSPAFLERTFLPRSLREYLLYMERGQSIEQGLSV